MMNPKLLINFINFSVHNSVKYNEDCICIVQRTCKLYIYLIRQNNDECFYVRNIILKKFNIC